MRRLFPAILFLAFLVWAISCQQKKASNDAFLMPGSDGENPPARGFDWEYSDDQAISIADSVMKAMGGRKNWDNTRYIEWNFFGRRKLLWDKWDNKVRIKMLDSDSTQMLLNMKTMEGKVMKNGEELSSPDSVKKYLDQAMRIWTNDSYWLVMPYKLKDSGVTIKYLGEDTTQTGTKCDLLQLTFEKVGVTPDNKYHIWVDKKDHLVRQWAYYKEASQTDPNFVLPWLNYEKHGNILLSGDRGQRKLTDIKVLDEVPKHTFDEFDAMSM